MRLELELFSPNKITKCQQGFALEGAGYARKPLLQVLQQRMAKAQCQQGQQVCAGLRARLQQFQGSSSSDARWAFGVQKHDQEATYSTCLEASRILS